MNLQKRNILVTGGCGYIGSHTVVQLLNAGARVTILDNLCNSSRGVIERIQAISGVRPDLVVGDIQNRIVVRRILEEQNTDVVMHFAGLKAVGESVVEPLRYYNNNVSGSIILFEEMARAKIKTLVFSSSATVYDYPVSLPILEDSPLKAANPYGQTKIAIESILGDIYRSDKSWKIAILRYFNPVGAHESGLIGENPLGTPNNLVPFIAQVAIGIKSKLMVYGGDYQTLDGTGVRDYIHVEDLARGHIAAINHLLMHNEFITVNLGTGRGYSVLEVVKAFECVSGRSIPFEIVGRRQGDVAECYANSDKAKELLLWVAKFDLNRMCEDVWRWQLANPTGY